MAWQAGGFDPSQAVKGHLRDILIPSCITLAGSLIPLILNWFRDRDIEARRVRLVDAANKHVLFWKNWFEAMVSVAPEADQSEWRNRAQQHLIIASGLVEVTAESQATSQHAARTADHFDAKREGLPRWRRWLLLYRPPRPLAWIPRLMFYSYILVCIGFWALVIAGSSSESSGPPDTLATNILTSVLFIALIVLVSLLFRWLSVLLEKPKRDPAHQLGT